MPVEAANVLRRATTAWAHAFVEELAARHPGVVLVEMGWPAAWRPLGVRAYVATYGAGQVNARAATERLLAPG